MNLIEKSAYIKGLAEGLDYDKTTKEGKLIAALLDMVDVMAKRIETLEDAVDELNEYIEEIDEDLGDVRNTFARMTSASATAIVRIVTSARIVMSAIAVTSATAVTTRSIMK